MVLLKSKDRIFKKKALCHLFSDYLSAFYILKNFLWLKKVVKFLPPFFLLKKKSFIWGKFESRPFSVKISLRKILLCCVWDTTFFFFIRHWTQTLPNRMMNAMCLLVLLLYDLYNNCKLETVLRQLDISVPF